MITSLFWIVYIPYSLLGSIPDPSPKPPLSLCNVTYLCLHGPNSQIRTVKSNPSWHSSGSRGRVFSALIFTHLYINARAEGIYGIMADLLGHDQYWSDDSLLEFLLVCHFRHSGKEFIYCVAICYRYMRLLYNVNETKP